MNKKILSIGLLFFLCLVSCRKDEVIDVEINEMIEEKVFMMNVSGIIEDVAGAPLADVSVTIGSKITSTDENGVFLIKGVDGKNIGSYVSANKEGYFSTGKNIYASSNGDYTLNIKMLPRGTGHNFNAGDGISVTISDEAELAIPANSISLNGTPYTGEAVVYSTWLDPTLEQTFETMPGNLNGVDEDANRVGLQTFGMIAVDILTPGGAVLNIAEGARASLKFPIPDELSSQAPDNIDLWHFDEVSGDWVEEGQATKSGSHYLAEVSHFSWWNCDIPSPITLLCLEFVDSQGVGLLADNIFIEISSDTYGTATAYINDASEFCGIVPQNNVMTLSIYSFCGDLLWSEEIGPYTTETAEEVIEMDATNVRIINVTGVITDCDDNPSGNAYVILEENQNSFIAFTNEIGEYQIQFYACQLTGPEIDVKAVDLNAFKQASDSFTLESNVDNYELDIKACDNVALLDPFFQFSDAMGNVFTTTNCFARVTPAETLIVAEAEDFEVILGISGFSTGDFTGNLLGLGTSSATELDLTDFNITVFGDVDENIIGTFIHSGTGEEGTFIAIRIQ